jgi:hypothetical protein
MIPRVVHLVFGLREQDEPFHLLHHLAVVSCREVLQPDEVVMHLHHEPHGPYWDLTLPLVTVERITPVAEVERRPVDADVAPYRYAHHADVVRLDVLARHGGLYSDIDVLWRAPLPDGLWEQPAVIGAEAPVRYSRWRRAERSVSNAVILAEPGSAFVTTWREQIVEAMDGTWSNHSCRLATRLAAAHPDLVHVEPQQRFCGFGHTPEGMAELLVEPMQPGRLDEPSGVHLCEHLWWADDRLDFVSVSASTFTEEHLRQTQAPIGHLARPFLPLEGRP